MIPLLAGMALYHFTLSMRLPDKQYTGTVTNCSTDLLSLHPWGSCVSEKNLHPSLLIAFLEVLPHLPLIISYLMRILVKTQCCAGRNGNEPNGQPMFAAS